MCKSRKIVEVILQHTKKSVCLARPARYAQSCPGQFDKQRLTVFIKVYISIEVKVLLLLLVILNRT